MRYSHDICSAKRYLSTILTHKHGCEIGAQRGSDWLAPNVKPNCTEIWCPKVQDLSHLCQSENFGSKSDSRLIGTFDLERSWVSCQSQSTQYLFSRLDHSSSRQHVDGACKDDYMVINIYDYMMTNTEVDVSLGCWWECMAVCQQSVCCLFVDEIGCCQCSSIPHY